MDNIELVFNETTGEWGEKPEPYIRLEIATKEDFEFLEKAVAFYENRDDYVKVTRCCECRFWTEGRHHTGRCKALIDFHDAERYVTDEGHFCSYGERKDNA